MIFKVFFGIVEILKQWEALKGLTRVRHLEHDNRLAIALSAIWDNQKPILKKEEVFFSKYYLF
jgi:hypothetical protein